MAIETVSIIDCAILLDASRCIVYSLLPVYNFVLFTMVAEKMRHDVPLTGEAVFDPVYITKYSVS